MRRFLPMVLIASLSHASGVALASSRDGSGPQKAKQIGHIEYLDRRLAHVSPSAGEASFLWPHALALAAWLPEDIQERIADGLKWTDPPGSRAEFERAVVEAWCGGDLNAPRHAYILPPRELEARHASLKDAMTPAWVAAHEGRGTEENLLAYVRASLLWSRCLGKTDIWAAEYESFIQEGVQNHFYSIGAVALLPRGTDLPPYEEGWEALAQRAVALRKDPSQDPWAVAVGGALDMYALAKGHTVSKHANPGQARALWLAAVQGAAARQPAEGPAALVLGWLERSARGEPMATQPKVPPFQFAGEWADLPCSGPGGVPAELQVTRRVLRATPASGFTGPARAARIAEIDAEVSRLYGLVAQEDKTLQQLWSFKSEPPEGMSFDQAVATVERNKALIFNEINPLMEAARALRAEQAEEDQWKRLGKGETLREAWRVHGVESVVALELTLTEPNGAPRKVGTRNLTLRTAGDDGPARTREAVAELACAAAPPPPDLPMAGHQASVLSAARAAGWTELPSEGRPAHQTPWQAPPGRAGTPDDLAVAFAVWPNATRLEAFLRSLAAP